MIDTAELEGHLCVTTADEINILVAQGYRDLVLDTSLIRHLHAEVERQKFDVCIFDPLVQLHGTSETDPGHMNRVIGVFKDIATDHDCATEIVAHTRKPAAGIDEDYDVNDMRGSSAIKDALRVVRVLNIMTKREAQDAGIEEHERSQFVRIDRAKGNYSAPGKARWVHFTGVRLPNDDDVAVIAPWTHPGQGGGETEAAEALFIRLLRSLAADGRYVGQAVNSPYYAPKVFAATKEAKAEKVSRAALAVAMHSLFSQGRIRIGPVAAGGRHQREAIVEVL